ncbi:MAG: pilus assembly protein PilP [Gammaproteobacteria bacterium]
MSRRFRSALMGCTLLLAGCGDSMEEMQARVTEIKQRPGGRIEPLPEIKPYETFAYDPTGLRSPFEPSDPAAGAQGGIRPDSNRTREFLEQYSLDTLRMVGTLRQGGRVFGLVQTKDGLVHRVSVGNYLGQADGRILAITEAKISLVEIVPDGLGGFIERPAALGLAD